MSSNQEDRVSVEVPAHELEPPRPITTRRVAIWGLVIIAAALVAGVLLFPERYDARTVPPSLIGEWVSDHPEYSDRYVTLTADSITFGVGGTSNVKYSILGIQTTEGEEMSPIILVFRDVAGTTFRREVILDRSGGSWFFASQPEVRWQKYGS